MDKSGKAAELLRNGNVKVRASTDNAVYFDVESRNGKVYDVFYIRYRNKWSCTCMGFALKLDCYHILACRKHVEIRGGLDGMPRMRN